MDDRKVVCDMSKKVVRVDELDCGENFGKLDNPQWTREAPSEDGFYPVLRVGHPKKDVAQLNDGDIYVTDGDSFMGEPHIEWWGPRIVFPPLPRGGEQDEL